jgi:hypothetical protein
MSYTNKPFLLSAAVIFAMSQITACSSDNDKNAAPSDILLSSTEITENEVAATVGSVSVTDSDANDTFTYSVSDTRFAVVDGSLVLAEGTSFNYEQEQTAELTITVEDSAMNEFSKTFTLDILDVLDTYSFVNSAGESSVSYSGQTARHLLILELNNYITTGLQQDLDDSIFADKAEVVEKLMSFFVTTDDDYDLDLGERVLTTTTSPESVQTTLKEISSSTKDISGKIAGNDATGQYKDWSTEFVAFGTKGDYSPESLIVALFDEIGDNAQTAIDGAIRQDALGNDITKVYLTADGRDLKQLIQKIITGAVAFSQGVDDYLDNDIDGKGLNADNTALVDGKTYTNLEHQYDEGFGYFGAARDYLDYSDDEIAIKGGRDDWQGMHDTNADGEIDFLSEFNFGHSGNAAKRDRGTADNANPTDFTAAAMNAFLQGRQIIADSNATALTTDQTTALLAQRDIAVANWEYAIAATAIHYINDTSGDYASWGTDDFNFEDVAKHWSELKGFLVSLQFNPRSPLTEADLIEANTLIGDAPVLTNDNGEVADYLDDLISARDILEAAYGFDSENVANW